MKKLIVLLITVTVLLVALPIVSAQETTPETNLSITFTEEQVNSTFWVTNPANRSVTSVYVDLQSENGGQVTISAVYSWRTRAGVRSADVEVVLTPRITSNRLVWDVVSVTADGEPASRELVAQLNVHLSATWRRWIVSNAPAGVLTAITITDDDITYTVTPR
jgi:hypothetical protein